MAALVDEIPVVASIHDKLIEKQLTELSKLSSNIKGMQGTPLTEELLANEETKTLNEINNQ